jgi:hypothetical protein
MRLFNRFSVFQTMKTKTVFFSVLKNVSRANTANMNGLTLRDTNTFHVPNN